MSESEERRITIAAADRMERMEDAEEASRSFHERMAEIRRNQSAPGMSRAHNDAPITEIVIVKAPEPEDKTFHQIKIVREES